MDTGNLQAKAREAGALLKAMGNERRLLILCQLAGGEKSVGELEEAIDLSQSALSQHLARLRKDGLVQTRRKAQTIFYSIDSAAAAAVMQDLAGSLVRSSGNSAVPRVAQTPEETGAVSAGRVSIQRTPTAASAAQPAMNDMPPTGATAPNGLGPWIASR